MRHLCLSLMALALALALPGLATAESASNCRTLLQAVPLHEQQTDFTCGAACSRALIQYWTGKRFSEETLARVLGTDLLGYTPLANIQFLLSHFRLSARPADNLSFEDLQDGLRRGESLLALVTLEDEPHYVIVTAVGPAQITLMDPWTARQGAYRTLSAAAFLKIWSFDLDGRTYRRSAMFIRR